MNNRGAILVLILLAAGLAAAIGAIWHQYRQTRRTLVFWGPEVARRIDRAHQVELLDLRANANTGTSADPTGQRSPAVDISRARGLVHFRRSLLEDLSFDWSAPAPAVPEEDWDFGVRFSDDDGSAVLTFELDRGIVAKQASGPAAAVLAERTTSGLNRFFEECLEATD